jgi:hypothetical protein
MSYTTINGMRSARYPLQGMGDSGDGLGACAACPGGMGVDLNSPVARTLGGMAVATVITGGVIFALVWGTKAPKSYRR